MGEFKYWMVGRERVHIVERFGTTTLVEYVTSGKQASVSTAMVIACKATPKKAKNPKKQVVPKAVPPKRVDNNNQQISLDL